MSLEANKVVVRRILEELWHRGEEAAASELLTDDTRVYDRSQPPMIGRDAYLEWMRSIRAAYVTGLPDWKITIEELVAEGSRVAKRYVLRGTHTGDFLGVRPTGKRVEIRAMSLYGFAADGRVAESWFNYDFHEAVEQLQAQQYRGTLAPEIVVPPIA